MDQTMIPMAPHELVGFGRVCRLKGRWWVCPACNHLFPTFTEPRYCPHCAQLLREGPDEL